MIAHLHFCDVSTDLHAGLVGDAGGLHLGVELLVLVREGLRQDLAGGLDRLHLRVQNLADVALELVALGLDILDREADDGASHLYGHRVLRLEAELVLQ